MPDLVGYLLLFVLVGFGFIFVHLVVGKLIRPARPDAEKLTIYECGEPTIGSAWVQFDLRYYVVALLFVIFDVEVAFFFPWAVVFGTANDLGKMSPPETEEQLAQFYNKVNQLTPNPENEGAVLFATREPVRRETQQAARQFAWIAFFDIVVFFGVLLVGFAYLWRRGDINWVRSVAAEREVEKPALAETRELVGAGS